MSAKDCIDAIRAAAGGKLTDDEILEIAERIERRRQRLAAEGRLDNIDQRLRQAAREEGDGARLAAALQRKHAALTAIARDRIEAAILQHVEAGLDYRRAVLAVLEGTTRGIESGRHSVAATKLAFEGRYVGDMMAAFQRERPHVIARLRDKAFLEDVVREMYELRDGGNPGRTGNRRGPAPRSGRMRALTEIKAVAGASLSNGAATGPPGFPRPAIRGRSSLPARPARLARSSSATFRGRAMVASLLTRPPAVNADTVEDVLAIAHAIEREAVARYSLLGDCMRRLRHDDVAAVFEALAAEERQHVEGIERLSRKLVGRLPSPAVAQWDMPEIFRAAGEDGLSALLTPYRALSIAVQNEERAFAFWSYVAAEAAGDAVRTQAEAMARQELFHAARLRSERRRAYHAERRAGLRAETDVPRDAAAMRKEAARLGEEAAAFLAAAADRLDRMADETSAALARQIAGEMRATPAGGRPGAADAAMARAAKAFAAGGNAALLFEAAGVLERLADRCLAMMEADPDAAAAGGLEDLARAATGHLSRLTARLCAIEPALAAAEPGGRARD